MAKKINKTIKRYYDSDNDTYWIVFKSGTEASYREVLPGLNLEFDKNSNVIGVEILDYVSKFLNPRPFNDNTYNSETKVEFSQKTYQNLYNIKSPNMATNFYNYTA